MTMNKTHMNAWLTISCLCLALLPPAAAQVYKWVDEKGVTHYGERAPKGAKSREVENKLANPAGPATGSAKPPDWQDQERAFAGRRIQAEQAEAKKQAQEIDQRRYCAEARDDLARTKASTRLYKLNEKGERVFSSDQEREASIARQEQNIAARCR